MASLTSCMRKAGDALSAEARAAILKRAAELRAEGITALAAGKMAVQEQLDAVTAKLAASSQPAEDDRPALELTAPTTEELQATADRANAAAQADAAEQKRLANKAKADTEVGEFVLTGSDRAADVGAAAGQGDIFDAPAADPATEPVAKDTYQYTDRAKDDWGDSFGLTVDDFAVAIRAASTQLPTYAGGAPDGLQHISTLATMPKSREGISQSEFRELQDYRLAKLRDAADAADAAFEVDLEAQGSGEMEAMLKNLAKYADHPVRVQRVLAQYRSIGGSQARQAAQLLDRMAALWKHGNFIQAGTKLRAMASSRTAFNREVNPNTGALGAEFKADADKRMAAAGLKEMGKLGQNRAADVLRELGFREDGKYKKKPKGYDNPVQPPPLEANEPGAPGYIDPADYRILKREPGQFLPAERDAYNEFLKGRDDAKRIRAALKKHAGTPWAKQAVEGIFTRQAMKMLLDGKTPTFQSSMDSKQAASWRKLLESRDIERVWSALEGDGGFMGAAAKPVNNVNSSFINCEPSGDCAKYCYATGGNYRYANVIVKSELVTMMVEIDPVRAATRVAQEFKATAEFAAGKALRLFDKGDGDMAWVPFITELNKQGVRVHVFSKVPEFLRAVPAVNLRLLSIDDSNMALADQNLDLPVAFVYTSKSQIDALAKMAERGQIQVVLPVKLGQKLLDGSEIKDLKKGVPAVKPYLCPVDAGFKPLGKSSQPGTWNCTKCDVNGGIGCFHGNPSKTAMQVARPPSTRDKARRIIELRKALNGLTQGTGNDQGDAAARGADGAGQDRPALAQDGRDQPGLAAGLLRQIDELLGDLLRDYDDGTEAADDGQPGGRAADAGQGTDRDVRGRRVIPIRAATDVAKEPDAAPYNADLFGFEVPTPAPRAGGSRPRRPAATAGNVDAAAGVSAPPGNYATRTALVTTRDQQLGASRVRSVKDAANALGYLNKSAVERLDALVTDAQGTPLAVVGGFKGALTQTSVHASTILGEALQVPGAANVWLVHNHPSGRAELSSADTYMAQAVDGAFEGTGIKVRGILAVTKEEWTGGPAEDQFRGVTFGQLSAKPGVTVPAQERQLVKDGKLGAPIDSPNAAKRVVADMVKANGGQPVIVLMDAQHAPVAAIPWAAADAMPLKDNGKLDALLRAVAESNAGAAIIGSSSSMTMAQAQNLGAGLAKMDVRVLDIIDAKGKSVAEQGLNTKGSILFSLADDNPPPFYSALELAVGSANMKTAPAAGWQQLLRGLVAKGTVKADEVEWTGINEWLGLQEGKVTREAVVEFLANNGVRVEETVLSDEAAKTLPDGWAVVDYGAGNAAQRFVLFDEDDNEVGAGATEAEAIENAQDSDALSDTPVATKYGDYTLPGGTNYREVLLTLPREPDFRVDDFIDSMAKKYGREAIYDVEGATFTIKPSFPSMLSEADRAAYRRAVDTTKPTPADYRSSHWDQKNILAHIRVNDRTDADGKRVLFVEEIQSDWAQEGKKKGFKQPIDPQRVAKAAAKVNKLDADFESRRSLAEKAAGDIGYWTDKLRKLRADPRTAQADIDNAIVRRTEAIVEKDRLAAEVRQASDELIEAMRDQEGASRSDGLPQAPFVTATDKWVALAMKRVVKMAVDGGYDRVAFVTGEQSAERYDLSKQVESIEVVPRTDAATGEKTRQAVIYMQAGGQMTLGVDGKGIVDNATGAGATRDLVGKSLSDVLGKEVADRVMTKERGFISGEGLRVGGEGMRAFYDKIVPAVAKDVLRKLGGGQLETVALEDSTPVATLSRTTGRYFVTQDGPTFETREEANAWARDQVAKQPGFTITPAMREKAAGGMPLFAIAKGGSQADTASYGSAGQTDADAVARLAASLNRGQPRSLHVVLDAVAPRAGASTARGREASTVASVAKRLFGHRVVFVRFQGPALFNGVVLGSEPGVIFINADAKKPMMAVLGHELLHKMAQQSPDLYRQLKGRLARLMKNQPEYMERIRAGYAAAGRSMPADWMEELHADVVGDFFTDGQFWRDMAAEQPSLFKRLATAVIKFLNDVATGLRAFGTDRYLSDISAARDAVTAAMREYSGTQVGSMADQQDDLSFSLADAGQMQTPAFRRWFGDSKVREPMQSSREKFADKKPLVVYHATNADITEFEAGRATINSTTFGDVETSRAGIFFAEDAKFAEQYLRPGPGKNVLPVYLSIQNPLYLDEGINGEDLNAILKQAEPGKMTARDFYYIKANDWWSVFDDEFGAEFVRAAKAAGFDGAYMTERNPSDRNDGESYGVWVAFKPEQIKSATGNNGAFAPANPDIRFSLADSPARQGVTDFMSAMRQGSTQQFNALHKTISTQLHKASVNADFKRVFDIAQDYEQDIARAAARPAELAPDVLPKFDNAMAAVKRLVRGDKEAAGVRKVGDAIFAGTLENGPEADNGVVWSDQQLRSRFGLDDKGVEQYRQTRAAIDASLDETAAALAYQMVKKYARQIKGAVRENPAGTRQLLLQTFGAEAGEIAAMMGEARKVLASTKESASERAAAFATLKEPGASEDAKREAGKTLKRTKDAAEQRRDAADKLRTMEQQTDKGLAAAVAALEVLDRADQLKAGAYAPLMRFGRFAVDVVQNGERVHFEKFDTETEAKVAAIRLRRQYPGASVERSTMSEEAYKLFAGVDPESMILFADQLEGRLGEIISDQALQEWYRKATADRSALKRMIAPRKGMAGYSPDIRRVLANFITSNARLAARQMSMGDMSAQIADMQERRVAGDVVDEAMKLREYLDNPDEPFKGMRSLMFAWYLGGSIASAAVNLTQPVMMTLPYLSQFGNATKHLIGAAKSAATGKVSDPTLQAALERAAKDGKVDPQEIHHLYHEGMQSLVDRLPAGNDLKARAQGFGTLWGAFFGAAENFNRRITFIAAYRMAAADTKLGDPYAFAVKAIDDTQGIYSKSNRPNWARGTGSFGAVGVAAFTFKQYSISYVELLVRMGKSGPKGKRAALAMLGMLLLTSGLQGLPGAEDLEDLIDSAAQGMGMRGNSKAALREALVDAWGTAVADTVMYGGLDQLLPASMSSRLGMGNLLPATAVFKRSEKERRLQNVLEITGAPGSFVEDVFSAFDALGGTGGVDNLVAAFAPVAVKNAFMGMSMADKGYYSDTRGQRVADTTPADAMLKGIGFQPTRVAEKRRPEAIVGQDIRRVRGVEADIVSLRAQAIIDQDPELRAQAKEMLDNWNENNPDLRIRVTEAQVLKKVQAMRRTSGERLLNTAPRETRRALMEDL